MGRPATKTDLISAANENYEEMNSLIASLTEKELATPFDFSADEKKKEAHWQRDKNLRDVLIHLYEWHQLLIHWVESNRQGDNVPFLPKPYNWKTYGDMNRVFWKRNQEVPLERALEQFKESHQKIMEVIQTMSNEELFQKNVYDWVGGSTIGSYFVSVTSSHYDWAMKKLKAHKKMCI